MMTVDERGLPGARPYPQSPYPQSPFPRQPPSPSPMPSESSRERPNARRTVELRWVVALVSLALLVGGGIGFTLPHPEPADIADDPTVSAPVITEPADENWREVAMTWLRNSIPQCAVRNDPYILLVDDGTTLKITTAGLLSPGTDLEHAACITVALGMPNTMWDEIAATTPRDGTVTDTWDEYEATWSYDPDTGLDLVIEIIGG